MLLGCAIMAACGGEPRPPEQTGAGAAPAAAPAAPPGLAASTGPVDRALAEQGGKVFQSKGCIGCHTIGTGKLTGPDLQGVTDRRSYGWFVPWVMNPDSMLKVDPTARQLLAQYMTPMLGMGVTQDEARALWEYLRHQQN